MAKEAVYTVFKTVDDVTTEIMTGESKKNLRRELTGILATKNVDSEAGKSAVDFLGGTAWAELFAAAGNPDDLITVKIDGESKAEYKRSNVAKRVEIAASVADFTGKIFTLKSEKTESASQVVDVE